MVGAVVYTGRDPAGQQLSAVFGGSKLVHKYIESNMVSVKGALDDLTTSFKYEFF